MVGCFQLPFEQPKGGQQPNGRQLMWSRFPLFLRPHGKKSGFAWSLSGSHICYSKDSKGKMTLRILDPVSGFRGVTSAACFDRRFHGGEWWLLATRSCGRQLEDGTSDDVLLHFEKSLLGASFPLQHGSTRVISKILLGYFEPNRSAS